METIAYYERVNLSEDEAGFIAFHFINGSIANNNGSTHTLLTTEMLEKVILLVEDVLEVNLDEESLHYIRFITHLKFFIQRIASNEYRQEVSPSLFDQVVSCYPESAKCVTIIKEYFQKKLKCKIYPEEEMYLILHVQRLLK